MVPKEKLVQGLRVLYKLWNKEYDMFPSNENLTWESGKLYKFYQKYSKRIGLDMDVDSLYFWINALILNEESLDSDSLTTDNLIVPPYNEFAVETRESRSEDMVITYSDTVQGYYTQDQLESSFYELGSGEHFDMYDFSEIDRDYVDSDSNGMELYQIDLIDSQIQESVKKIKSTKQPDFDLFIESLTESEAKFLIEKLQKKLL